MGPKRLKPTRQSSRKKPKISDLLEKCDECGEWKSNLGHHKIQAHATEMKVQTVDGENIKIIRDEDGYFHCPWRGCSETTTVPLSMRGHIGRSHNKVPVRGKDDPILGDSSSDDIQEISRPPPSSSTTTSRSRGEPSSVRSCGISSSSSRYDTKNPISNKHTSQAAGIPNPKSRSDMPPVAGPSTRPAIAAPIRPVNHPLPATHNGSHSGSRNNTSEDRLPRNTNIPEAPSENNAANNTLRDFLDSLRQPLGDQLGIFNSLGFYTMDHIEVLGEMDEDDLARVELKFGKAGLVYRHWLIFRQGLKKHFG
ncbi:hypothetical protein C8Q75DRAFT_784889 [Abortiporus biennis]|nr:hypothetical protein C8Q75DRAFT_784889 [Abortiporus biennis]